MLRPSLRTVILMALTLAAFVRFYMIMHHAPRHVAPAPSTFDISVMPLVADAGVGP